MCTHSGRSKGHTYTPHTHLLSGGEIQTLLIPLAFVCPTKAGLQLFLPVELNP